MSNYRIDRAEFFDVFPAEERLLHRRCGSNHDVLMVDIGGGLGHEIEKFMKKFPEEKARMILQDQPNVLSQVQQSNMMEVMAYDFFTPQPVEGRSVPQEDFDGHKLTTILRCPSVLLPNDIPRLA